MIVLCVRRLLCLIGFSSFFSLSFCLFFDFLTKYSDSQKSGCQNSQKRLIKSHRLTAHFLFVFLQQFSYFCKLLFLFFLMKIYFQMLVSISSVISVVIILCINLQIFITVVSFCFISFCDVVFVEHITRPIIIR